MPDGHDRRAREDDNLRVCHTTESTAMPPPASPFPPPPKPTATLDLSDEEFAELDDLLAATPEPLTPCDAVMLDGFLCGVLVQPVLLESATWLPHVFDFDAELLPDVVDP